ncbi:MAG: helix-turn-helix domain-containing protein [Brevundimonas sp.]
MDTPKEIAAALRSKVGLSAGYASELANLQRTPSLRLALKIEAALGIPPSHWVKSDSQAEAA